MKIGDLVCWNEVEICYHIACRAPGIPDLTSARKRGIIVDNNGINFFVRWENGELRVAKPNSIEVISESRQFSKLQM